MNTFVIVLSIVACAAAYPAMQTITEEHGYYPPPAAAAAAAQNHAAPMAYFAPEQPGYISMEGYEGVMGPSAPKKKKPKFFPSKEEFKAKALQSITEFKVGLNTVKEGLKSLIKMKKVKPQPAVAAYATSYDAPTYYAPPNNYAAPPANYGYGPSVY